MVLTHHNPEYEQLLYPLMVIAAVAVIVFSLMGIASMSGLMPHALLSEKVEWVSVPAQSDTSPAFGCAECGVIESLSRSTDKSQ